MDVEATDGGPLLFSSLTTPEIVRSPSIGEPVAPVLATAVAAVAVVTAIPSPPIPHLQAFLSRGEVLREGLCWQEDGDGDGGGGATTSEELSVLCTTRLLFLLVPGDDGRDGDAEGISEETCWSTDASAVWAALALAFVRPPVARSLAVALDRALFADGGAQGEVEHTIPAASSLRFRLDSSPMSVFGAVGTAVD